MNYNSTILEFLYRNNINPIQIPPTINRPLNTPDKETILSNCLYSISFPPHTQLVSIADVYGSSNLFLNGNYQRKLIDLLGDYFDRSGDSYHNRSVGILDFDSDEIISKLSSSFQYDVIYMTQIEDKYYININGNHRVLIILFHYLKSVTLNPEKEEILRNLYKIPVKVSTLNLEISGMLFLLKMKYGRSFRMNSFVIEEPLCFSLDNKTYQMSLEQFKVFTKREMLVEKCKFHQFREICFIMIENSKHDKHFKNAMVQIFPELLELDWNQTDYLLKKTFQIEDLFEHLNFDTLSLKESIELIKITLLQHKIEELKQAMEKRRKLFLEIEKLEQEQRLLKQKYYQSFKEEAQENLYKEAFDIEIKKQPNSFENKHERNLLGFGLWVVHLLQIKKELENQIEVLKQKRLIFRRKKKIKKLEFNLSEIKRQLNQIPYWHHFNNTFSPSIMALEQVKKVNFSDFETIRLDLKQKINELEEQKRKLKRMNDGLTNILYLKQFCDNCNIDFDQVCIENGFININEEKELKQMYYRRILCQNNFWKK